MTYFSQHVLDDDITQDPYGMHLINGWPSYQSFIIYALDKHHPSPIHPQAGANGAGAWNESAGEQLRWASYPNDPNVWNIQYIYLYTWLKYLW